VIRQPVVAGRFYAQSEKSCAEEVRSCVLPLENVRLDKETSLRGAIVPHAGWVCSGKVAASALAALAAHSSPSTIILFGATHRMVGKKACMYDQGAWETPLGQAEIDVETGGLILQASDDIVADQNAHAYEHSLEVQIPFIQHLFTEVKILPILVPPSEHAPTIGQVVGRVLREYSSDAVVIGTTDLTHYGPSYGMTSHGTGQKGLDWAKNENDRRMIDSIMSMEPARIVPVAKQYHNACGPGAVAATMAACIEMKATNPILLEHTTSAETLIDVSPGQPRDAVGYAGFVFASPPEDVKG